MNWRIFCQKYWNTYTNNLTISFCNQGSFMMAMRMKYGMDIDESSHHWNTIVVDEKIRELRLKDVREYQKECTRIGKRT